MNMVIYKTTNLVNGKFYVGKDAANNPSYLGSGLLISQAIKKYGRENFKKEILELCCSLDELNDREKFWIKKLHATDRGTAYNLTEGGTGGSTLMFHPNKNTILKNFKKKSAEWSRSEIGRKFHSEHTTKMWKNPDHKNRIVKIMTGRKILWKDKISKSIIEWHKTNPITKDGKRRMFENGKRTKGREIFTVEDEIKNTIIKMYSDCGPKTISNNLKRKGIIVSPFIIIRILKKVGIYKKYQKGIGKFPT